MSQGKKDIVLVLAAILLLEIGIRLLAPVLSGNVRQIEAMSDTAADMARHPPALLFLGNSLTGNAVDTETFSRLSGLKLNVYMAVPDSTSLWDWYCIIDHTFVSQGAIPEVVVIGYAWGRTPPVPQRLGGFFCRMEDLPVLYRLGMNHFDQIMDFIVARVLRLYALHEVLQKRILDLFVPQYREFTQEINAEARARKKKNHQRAAGKRRADETDPMLAAWLERLQALGIKPVVVAMPVIDPYLLPHDFFDLIDRADGIAIDFRNLPGIGKKHFRDPIHLNEQGRAIFTQALARRLHQALPTYAR